MKKSIELKGILIVILALTMVLGINYSYASSVTVAASSTSLTVGSSATLTISGNDLIGKISITSSNPGVISLSSSQEWIEGAVTVRATANAAGNAYITISSVDTSSASTGEAVNVSTGVNLNVKEVVVDTRSANNYLSSLKVEGYELSPAFNANTSNYSLTVPSDVSQIKLSAYPADAKSTTVVEGNLDLVAGENNVTVTVKAENGYRRVYTIVVTKEKNPDDIDVTVEELAINNAKLKGTFDPEIFEYMCEDITADIDKLDISVKTKIPDLKCEITGNDELKQGINHIKIKVISRDGSTSKEYEIIVYKTDEVLALVEMPEEEPEQVVKDTIIDKIKRHKVRTAVCAGGALLFIIIVILIIVISKKIKNRRKYDDENNGWLNYEDDTDTTKEEVNEVKENNYDDISLNDLPEDTYESENDLDNIEDINHNQYDEDFNYTEEKNDENDIESDTDVNEEEKDEEVLKINFDKLDKQDNDDKSIKLDLSSLKDDEE